MEKWKWLGRKNSFKGVVMVNGKVKCKNYKFIIF